MAIAGPVLGVDERLGGYRDLLGVSGGCETVLKGSLRFVKVLCGGMVGTMNMGMCGGR